MLFATITLGDRGQVRRRRVRGRLGARAAVRVDPSLQVPAPRGRGRAARAAGRGAARAGRRARADRADHRLVRLVAVGLSHHRAAFGLLGRVALHEAEARCLLQNLAGGRGARVGRHLDLQPHRALPRRPRRREPDRARRARALRARRRARRPSSSRCSTGSPTPRAALHLNRVASGLDSLVPGEAQVLGQVRTALALAQSEGTAGPVISRVFQRALETGKRVAQRDGHLARATPRSPRSPRASPSTRSAASAGRAALVVGAGPHLRARCPQPDGPRAPAPLGREPHLPERARAGRSARRRSRALRGRRRQPARHVDVVVSSTSAPHAVLRADMVAPAIVGRSTPLVFLDLAVPADVDPDVGSLAGCEVHGMDDLASEIARTVAFRREEAAVAETICAEAAEDFRAWQVERTVGPAIGRLRARAEAVRAAEVDAPLGRARRRRARAPRAALATARRPAAAPSHDAPARQRERPGRRAVRRDRARPVRPRRRPVLGCSASGREARASRSTRRGWPQTRCAPQASGPSRSSRSRRSATATAATASRSSAAAASSAPSSRRRSLADEIDVAVHSAKDLTTEHPAGLELAAVLPRADPRDAWCGPQGSLDDVPRGRARRHGLDPAHGAARRASGPTWRSRGCAATSTRACASAASAASRRSCSRPAASTGSVSTARSASASRPS